MAAPFGKSWLYLPCEKRAQAVRGLSPKAKRVYSTELLYVSFECDPSSAELRSENVVRGAAEFNLWERKSLARKHGLGVNSAPR